MTVVILLFAMLLLPSLTMAEPGPDLAKIFPFEATITSEQSGLNRIDLPVDVLSKCRRDLSDLRIFDLDGRELPYFIESFDSGQDVVEVVRSQQGMILDVKRREKRSQTGPARYIESYELSVPPLPAEARTWELVLKTTTREFVNRISITGRRSDGSSEKILENASAFRVTSPKAERLRFEIPNAGFSSIIIELEGEDARFLSPALSFEARRYFSQLNECLVDLELVLIEDVGSTTAFVVKRPRGIVPDRLRVETSSGAFKRKITVWDDGPGRVSSSLASATLFRIDAIAAVENIELSINPPHGDHLRISIENRDSPPLAKVRISALVNRPFLFFSMPQGQTKAILRFGGARARRPDYDLEALRPPHGPVLSGESAESALVFWDPAKAHQAKTSKISDNRVFDPQPALAFAMHAGAELKSGPFSHRRVITVQPSAEGLSRLTIGPEDLAIARPDLGDLRIVDDQQHQWAYLLEHSSGFQRVSLNLERHRRSQGESRYEIDLPYSPITINQIDFSPESPFYDRTFSLEGETEADKHVVLASGRLKRHQGDPRPADIAFTSIRVKSLELIIEDGDDAPLSLGPIHARTQHSILYLAAPAGSYELLLGHPDAKPARYELKRVRSTVLAVPAGGVEAGPLETNPAFNTASRFSNSSGAQKLTLWIVLAIAVFALAILTLRLARQEN